MSMGEFFGELLIGALLIYTSYQIGWKENIGCLHAYHWRNIPQEEQKPFCRKMGIGGMAVGVGIFCMPLLNVTIGFDVGYYLGLAAILLGCGMMAYTVLHDNGMLFAFRKK